MQDFVMVTGMVIKTIPVGEYDKHVCILTKEKGKITAYAKGARRPNSRLVAATNPFSFGEFKLYVGKSSYNLLEAGISNYFEPLREDFEAAYYGMYFLEMADYYTRENNDERNQLKLLYQSMRALIAPNFPNELVRRVYEMKSLVVNGEFPGIPTDRQLLNGTVRTIQFIMDSPIEKLYTFAVSPEILAELAEVSDRYCKLCIDRPMKSLEVLETLVKKG